ncbi:uncharacterized protein (UPF0261 family) [Novosphingobium sp. 1529]|uniref:MauE/DoxX family redox-associated membrane protein n=1 Tax=Novosphingobium sp. 1529 TaxID=3156424 RepID=UPI0033995437
MIDSWALLTGELAFAGLFLVSAAAKLARYQQFAAAIDSYMLVPMALVMPVAAILTGAELGTGLVLSGSMVSPFPLGVPRVAALTLASALLTAYAAAMAINLVRGRTTLGCGCAGFSKADTPISRSLVVRNLALAFAALVLAHGGANSRVLHIADLAYAVAAAVTILVLYSSFAQYEKNRAILKGSPR